MTNSRFLSRLASLLGALRRGDSAKLAELEALHDETRRRVRDERAAARPRQIAGRRR